MNSIVLLKSLFFSAFIGVSIISVGQTGAEDGSRYGHGEDSIRCVRNLSLYREFVRNRDYDMAYPYWQNVICQYG
jgi:hypothetical protein